MQRNITIVVIILIVVLLAGYLVWLRNRYAPSTVELPQATEESIPSVMTSTSSASASTSAMMKDKEATSASKAASQSGRVK